MNSRILIVDDGTDRSLEYIVRRSQRSDTTSA